MDNTEGGPIKRNSWKQGWISSRQIIIYNDVTGSSLAFANIENYSVKKSKLAVLNFFAFFF